LFLLYFYVLIFNLYLQN